MRKTQFVLSVLSIFVLVVASCGPAATTPAPTQPPAPTATSPAIVAVEATPTAAPTVEAAKYNEAPMLADMVAAGTLPAVEERLPDESDVQVVAPVESIGQYGGTWNAVTGDAGANQFFDAAGVLRTAAEWPSSNTSLSRTFSTTSLILRINSTAFTSYGVTHLFLDQVVQGGGAPQRVWRDVVRRA